MRVVVVIMIMTLFKVLYSLHKVPRHCHKSREAIFLRSLSSFPSPPSSKSSSDSTQFQSLLTPIKKVKDIGLGPKACESLKQLGINKLSDFLFHFPTSLIDRSQILTSIDDIKEDDDVVTIRLTVQSTKDGFGKSPHKVICSDSTGSGRLIGITYFMGKEMWMLKQWNNMKKKWFQPGNEIIVSGKVYYSSFTKSMELSNPQKIICVGGADDESSEEVFDVDPVYPLTQGITAPKLKAFIKHALDRAKNDLDNLEWMCPNQRQARGWPLFAEAIRNLHSPASHECLLPQSKYKERLAFDELVVLQLRQLEYEAAKKKDLEDRLSKTWGRDGRESESATPPSSTSVVTSDFLSSTHKVEENGILTNALVNALPFTLTKSQQLAITNIFEEMKSPQRMVHLVQGDVGSGKTVVAFMAMLRAIENNQQACLLAPTEILANQHYNLLSSHLENLQDVAQTILGRPCVIRLITGRVQGKARTDLLEDLKAHKIDILIGTHVLLNEEVGDSFPRLGLVVIDEEQRFGVSQRDSLAYRSNVLFTTATPIPRSLLLLLQEQYSVSTLTDKLPTKRPVRTVLLSDSLTDDIITRIRANLPFGSKVFWVTPSLHPSPTFVPGRSAMERMEHLSSVFPGQVGLLHGKMTSEEKTALMTNFSSPDSTIRILVATSVVEVGVDVPDASICIIDQADHFGLSQLHQIRGRIGRGTPPPKRSLRKRCVCYYARIYPYWVIKIIIQMMGRKKEKEKEREIENHLP